MCFSQEKYIYKNGQIVLKKAQKYWCEQLNTQKMRYALEETLGEEEEDEAEEEEASVQVSIPGDGDCFYSAIVEAFLRDGVDIVSLFAGRMGCEVNILNIL